MWKSRFRWPDPFTICTFTLLFIQLSHGCLLLPRPWAWASSIIIFASYIKIITGADTELTRPMDGHPLCCRAFICQTIESLPSSLGSLQPLHQPSSFAAILWFMMESKQMPEHRSSALLVGTSSSSFSW